VSLVDDVLKVLADGYAPYRGAIEGAVFEELRCPDFRRARWFTREGRHLCLGCGRRCAWAGAGFQAVLPIRGRTEIAFAALPMVTDGELLRHKLFLRLDEAARILRLSHRQVYRLLDDGQLDRLPDSPVRITSESIREYTLRQTVMHRK
jgi:predicted DNA-binding transcriptional regulator AlpA